MKKNIYKLGIVALVVLSIGFMQSCKNKEPSVVKVFVKNANNQYVNGAKVVIIGDVESNPPTVQYQDTLHTNESGFVHFNVEAHYEKGQAEMGDDYTTAYFDIIVKHDTIIGIGRVRSRVHTTAVETVYLPPN